MSASRRVYVDLDDVLCETARALMRLLAGMFGKEVAFEEIAAFNLQKSFGLTEGEYERFMAEAHRPEALSGIEPVPGAVEGVREWAEAGLDVCVVTGRPKACAAVTRGWLDRQGVVYSGLLFVDKYGRRDSWVEPGDLLSLDDLVREAFLFAVEDEPGTASYLLRNARMPVVLLSRPWNDVFRFDEEGKGSLVRCRDWPHMMAWWREQNG